jgi:Cys-rich repeat protein
MKTRNLASAILAPHLRLACAAVAALGLLACSNSYEGLKLNDAAVAAKRDSGAAGAGGTTRGAGGAMGTGGRTTGAGGGPAGSGGTGGRTRGTGGGTTADAGNVRGNDAASTGCGAPRGCRNGQVCDTTTNTCVDCLASADCPSATPACSTGHTCSVKCTPTADCSGRTPICETSTQACVECLADTDCGNGGVCQTDLTCG